MKVPLMLALASQCCILSMMPIAASSSARWASSSRRNDGLASLFERFSQGGNANRDDRRIVDLTHPFRSGILRADPSNIQASTRARKKDGKQDDDGDRNDKDGDDQPTPRNKRRSLNWLERRKPNEPRRSNSRNDGKKTGTTSNDKDGANDEGQLSDINFVKDQKLYSRAEARRQKRKKAREERQRLKDEKEEKKRLQEEDKKQRKKEKASGSKARKTEDSEGEQGKDLDDGQSDDLTSGRRNKSTQSIKDGEKEDEDDDELDQLREFLGSTSSTKANNTSANSTSNSKNDKENSEAESDQPRWRYPQRQQQQQQQQQQQSGRQGHSQLIILGSPSQSMHPRSPNDPDDPSQKSHLNQHATAQLVAEVAVALVGIATRTWIYSWIIRLITSDHEIMDPAQHFFWEVINNKYDRDEAILSRAFHSRPSGVTAKDWRSYHRTARPAHSQLRAALPTQTLVVVDITPGGEIDLEYISNVCTFLVKQHARQAFGKKLEVVLLVQSPGGGVTQFGLAASEIARLRKNNINVTVCIDQVAASGGYMMATQASRIIAAPFAYVGSIGVRLETFNFNKMLENYKVRPIVLHAGKNKNNLSMFGKVTDDGIQEEQKRLTQMHSAFIRWCTDQRPSLDLSICDGSIHIGDEALETGLVDRILTSSEYIHERMREGDYVLKLHKYSNVHVQQRLINLLPHVKKKVKVIITRVVQSGFVLNIARQIVAQAGSA